MTTSRDPRVERLRTCFETLTPASVARLAEFYAPDARFKDPFNDVSGVTAIQSVFEHMYRQVDQPRFRITSSLCEGDEAFLTWDFVFSFKGKTPTEQTVLGGTHIKFDAEGRVTLHRDYWDAAEELYEKLPVLGSLMRWLKRRARH